MCRDFTKTKDQCSEAIKQGVNEAFESTIHHLDTIKIISKAYLSNQECSIQEAVYHILSELKIRRTFLAVCFLTEIFQRKEFKYYFLKKNLANYQGRAHIFSRNQIPKY